jgi:hypothetical protein
MGLRSVAVIQRTHIFGDRDIETGQIVSVENGPLLIGLRISNAKRKKEPKIGTVQRGGMPAAALIYFQKPLTESSTGRLAFLASLRADSIHTALRFRNRVLDQMARMGVLAAGQGEAAKHEPLKDLQF